MLLVYHGYKCLETCHVVSYIAECPRGYYGDRCNETCGNCLEKSACRHDTGQCETGCAEGFTGSLCVQGTLSLLRGNDCECIMRRCYHDEVDQKI